jgi:hypothetical protein
MNDLKFALRVVAVGLALVLVATAVFIQAVR